MKALLFKELREVRGIAAVALVAYLALVANLMGAKVLDWVLGSPRGTEDVPFVGGEFSSWFWIISAVLAVALGFRQSAWESARGTYLFLLHRPLRRDAIFLAKLTVGLGVLVVCSSVPIVVYGVWAATLGHHPSPFAWSMTVPAWESLALMSLLYLGAFLSGLRPARWFGTRLLPLMGVLIGVVLLPSFRWGYSIIALTALLGAVLVGNICYVGRVRDYA
jgi:ABC-type transport system involved in multi-copper enzyme maturation permease subunit